MVWDIDEESERFFKGFTCTNIINKIGCHDSRDLFYFVVLPNVDKTTGYF